MAGAIYHNGQWYGLGGSEVLPNPQETATDTLSTVGIDGTVYAVTDADAVHTSDIGTANGVAELDANGLVPSSQLPSYVDDVLEYASVSAFPATGETGKIYVALDTNLTYRWSGSAYVEISPSLALGETSSTAYRGDRGKTAYDHATESGRSGAKSAGLYKIGVTAQGHVASATAVAKADLTALGVADQNDVDAIEEDIEGFKTVTGEYITINDAASLPAESYQITLSPVQDLNGYEYPWAAGAGKNKLPLTLAKFKTDNTYGSWNGNAYTFRGITYTVLTDSAGNVTGIDVDGTANSGNVAFDIKGISCEVGQKLNGTPSGGRSFISNSTGRIDYAVDTGSGGTVNAADSNARYYIQVLNGSTINHALYKPMLRAATETDTFAPYSNICPIHGADEVGVRVCGVNLWDEEWELGAMNGATGGNYPTNNSIRSKNYIRVKPGATYYGKIPTSYFNVYQYGKDKSYLGQALVIASVANREFTINANAYYIRLEINSGYGATYNHDISINYPSTDHDYHAFNGNSTTITPPSTVYGGSVEMGGSGEKTYIMVEYNGSNDENWERFSSGSAGAYAMQIALSAGMKYTSISALPPILANYLKPISQAATWGNYDGFVSANTSNDYLYTGIKSITTVADWRAYLAQNPLQVCYELATPTDISVTPFPQTLLDGVNNLWAEMVENNTVIDNAQQSLSYQPQNIVGQLRQEIEAKPDSFAQLSDTSFSNLANGQIPKWNSTSGKWENANESGGGGASSLAELSDTNISSPADGQILKWDGTSSKWVNAAEYSYTLPTASASTKGGIKVGDNLAMNGEVLSAKLPQWTKIWNYNSGATFSMPSGKTDIMLVIMVSLLVDNRAMSNVYPVEYPFSASLVCSYELDSALGGGTLAITVSTANTVTITNTSQFTSQVDFEIWVR